MTETLLQFVNGIPSELAVFIIAMAPVVELRGALPVALAVYQMPFIQAFGLVLLANMIPAFVIVYGWDWFIKQVSRYWPWLNRLLEKRYQKMQVQWDSKIEKYGPWALILFVAIPLPGSGVWSGSLAAWLFGIKKKHAMWAIFAGALISGIVVTIVTLGGLSLI